MSGDKAKEAFRSFDWENDETWKAYLRNVELPGTGDMNAAMQKLKARWYKRNIVSGYVRIGCQCIALLLMPRLAQQDGDFDVDSVASAPPKPSSASTPQAAAPTQRPAAASAAPQPRTASAGWGSTSSNSTSLAQSQQLNLAVLHMALIVTAIFHLIPVLPIANCSQQCYRWFMWLAVFAQGYKVFLKYGRPPVWPFNWQLIQLWLQRTMAGTDFFYAITSFAFIGNPSPITLAMAPVLMLAIRGIVDFAALRFGSSSAWKLARGPAAHGWMKRNENVLNMMSTWSEIGLGFLLIVLLITPARNFLLIFLYWSMLKTRYFSPESAGAHRTVWAHLDNRTIQYRRNFPMLEKAIQYVKWWFLNTGMRT